jgi:predicted ribosomally synthesized peptide with SipW-like signal peptide
MPFLISLGRDQLFKLVLLTALATGVLASVAGRGTLAYFTTQVTSTTNTFSLGTLHFNIADNNQNLAGNLTSVTSSITLTNMKPGDTVYAPITVKNVGTIDAQWGIKYTAANSGGSNLTPLLKIALVGRGSVTGTTAADCTHTADLTDDTVWAEQIAPALATLQASQTYVDGTSTVAPATNGEWVSADATAGAHLFLQHASGTLDTDVLCVQVRWPDGGTPGSLTTGDNAYNSAAAATYNTTIVFTFDGEQLNRNVDFDQQAGPTSGNY